MGRTHGNSEVRRVTAAVRRFRSFEHCAVYTGAVKDDIIYAGIKIGKSESS